MKSSKYNSIGLQKASPEEVKPAENIPSGKWMTVTQMRKLLGLQRTEGYWLVHKNVFETKKILGKMRVNVASFEDWYSRQIRYHKITGEEPGRKIKEVSYSAQDISELLEISEDRAYVLIKENNLATETVNYRMRVPKNLFDQWYSHQTRYLTKEDRESNAELFESTITMPQMARLLGIDRSTVYSILNSQHYGGLFEIIKLAGKKRITKDSFYTFLNSQNKYHLIVDADRKQKNPSELFLSNVDDPASTKQKNDPAGHLFKSRESLVLGLGSAENGLSFMEQQTIPASRQNISTSAYLPIAEAVRLAGISRQSVTKYADHGCFEMKKVAGKNWICRREFMEWLDKRKQKGGEDHGIDAKA